MPRQTADLLIQRYESRSARMGPRKARAFGLIDQFERVGKISVGKKVRKAIQHIDREVKRLANLPRRAASAIGDHRRGHGRAMRAVAAIDLLDDLFSPVATWQIDVDVRPALSSLTEEALEENIEL